VFRNAIKLTAQIPALLLTFVKVGLNSLASSEYRISAFSEYNIFSDLPLIGSVYIRLIF
jgi:hypothetical protein